MPVKEYLGRNQVEELALALEGNVVGASSVTSDEDNLVPERLASARLAGKSDRIQLSFEN